jgi:hypothetical protein
VQGIRGPSIATTSTSHRMRSSTSPPSPTSCITRSSSSAGLVDVEPLPATSMRPKQKATQRNANIVNGGEPAARQYPNWLLFCGVLAAGCSHAVLQEQLMKDMRGMPLLITSFEFGCCSLLSLIALLSTGGDPWNAPRWTLLRISTLVLTSLLSGNIALRWVAYPVKVCERTCPSLGARRERWHIYIRTRAWCAPTHQSAPRAQTRAHGIPSI